MLSIIGVDLTFRVFNLCGHVGSDQMPNGGLELIISPFQFYEDRYEFIGYLIDMDMEKDLVYAIIGTKVSQRKFSGPII